LAVSPRINFATIQQLTQYRWNANVPETADRCIHDLISDVVQEQPDAQAISAWDGQMSYAELEQFSTVLASEMIRISAQDGETIGRGTIVPLNFAKSMWTPVAALATIKTGAACVLLDVTLPVERLKVIVRQVSPKLVLSSKQDESLARKISGLPTIVVDYENLTQAIARSQNPVDLSRIRLQKPLPEDLLYLVFTSGSTGVAKGVKITHANFASALRHQTSMGITRTSRVYAYVSHAFDVSVISSTSCNDYEH
jgi:non-ribosomal peptide synthetase component F